MRDLPLISLHQLIHFPHFELNSFHPDLSTEVEAI